MRKPGAGAEIERLLALPWTVELRRNHDGTFFAQVVELPGCMTEGADEHEALRNLREAQALWLESEIARGATVPEPRALRKYSGKFTVRTSPLVHRLAAETAGRLGVSLNEFASEALALAASANLGIASHNGKARRTARRTSRKP
jgi:antitoxin HicB